MIIRWTSVIECLDELMICDIELQSADE
jgi:hypothetical protein